MASLSYFTRTDCKRHFHLPRSPLSDDDYIPRKKFFLGTICGSDYDDRSYEGIVAFNKLFRPIWPALYARWSEDKQEWPVFELCDDDNREIRPRKAVDGAEGRVKLMFFKAASKVGDATAEDYDKYTYVKHHPHMKTAADIIEG